MRALASHAVRSFGSLALLALLATACGDDSTSGQGGAGGEGATTATTGTTTSATTGTTSSATTSSATTSSATTSSTGGEGGSNGSGGAGGAGGAGQGGAGGGAPACPEQPAPYEVGDLTEDACADLAADPNAPAFHVEFIGEPTEVLDYDGTIAIDFAFPYVLALPIDDLASFTVVESRCQELAGDGASTCSEGEVDLSDLASSCAMRSSGRFGLDPSNVHPGLNTFDFTMTVSTGCAEVSDTFTLVVDYQPLE